MVIRSLHIWAFDQFPFTYLGWKLKSYSFIPCLAQVEMVGIMPFQVKPEMILLLEGSHWSWIYGCWFHQEDYSPWSLTSVYEDICPLILCSCHTGCIDTHGAQSSPLCYKKTSPALEHFPHRKDWFSYQWPATGRLDYMVPIELVE